MGQLFGRWRQARAKATAEREFTERAFASFLQETRPLVPRAPKHYFAALYRHAWKRAAVLEVLYQSKSDTARASLYRQFQKLAAARYFPVAPVGPYGRIPLRMEAAAATRLLEAESRRLLPQKDKRQGRRSSACIYRGTCEAGRVYIGQTQEAPERRWIQHRAEGTGPFKDGGQYPNWDIVEGEVPPAKLDERESYYIGLFDTFENGYNDTRGNDWEAYGRGCAARRSHPPRWRQGANGSASLVAPPAAASSAASPTAPEDGQSFARSCAATE